MGVDPSPHERELLWLRRARDLTHLLAAEQDASVLFPKILDAAIELTEAERGFLVKVQGRKSDGALKIKIMVARGFDGIALQGAQGNVSRTVVARVLEGTDGLVTTREEDVEVTQVSSVLARRVLSIICVPMVLRGEVRGVLYLDHRFHKEAFSERDLPALQTFADQAALAMETADLADDRSAIGAKLESTRGELERVKALLEPSGPTDLGQPRPVSVRFGGLVGSSSAMAGLYEQIERAARTWDPVLICGESGTGKELVARELHARGVHSAEPFFSENCAAVAGGVLESELFGHCKGAFTGASTDRKGLFALAGKGTLFLDEVGDMSMAMQGKLLRVLQEGVVRPVGADKQVRVHCRVLAATHRDLRGLVREGHLREDLYYRLDVLRINVPPLRKRPEDVLPLLEHFVREAGGAPLQITPRATTLLTRYSWPGNVRELQNEARRLMTVTQREISGAHLSAEIRDGRGVAQAPGDMAGRTLNEVERDMVTAALRDCGGNKSHAARQLGIPRSTLYRLIERHGLS